MYAIDVRMLTQAYSTMGEEITFFPDHEGSEESSLWNDHVSIKK
jgi:hypothetical protein